MAGPAATAPPTPGMYISRPTYNLYGMGIGAKKFKYDESMYSQLINNDIVPPGHFWCEWVDGRHLSIDYEKTAKGWTTRSVWQGEHYSDDNLTKFKQWTRLPNSEAIDLRTLTIGLRPEFGFVNRFKMDKINIEMKGDYVIEIHFRLGNDPFDDLPVHSRLIPVWDDEDAPKGKWRGNLHQDIEKYNASGHLSNTRKGYVIQHL